MTQTIRNVAVLFLFAIAALAAVSVARAEDAKPPATAPSTKPDQAGVTRFYGTISAIDTAANAFTVDNQTYTVTAETQMTKAADDKPATLADAVVGQPARGSYTKSADGKLNVTKVRFGKKVGGKAGGKGGGKKKTDATTQQQTQPR